MEAATETGATAIPVPLKWPLPLRPVAVEAHLCSLGTDGDARASIEAKKKEAPAKRTVKRARRARKERVHGRTYR